jgi:hypothetical protein
MACVLSTSQSTNETPYGKNSVERFHKDAFGSVYEVIIMAQIWPIIIVWSGRKGSG